MTRYKFWSLLSLVIVLMISLAACSQLNSSPTELSTQATNLRLSGFAARASFYESSECGGSEVWLFVSEAKQKSQSGNSEIIPMLDLYFSQYDNCIGEGFQGNYHGPLDPAAFEMMGKLDAATLNTSVEVYDWEGNPVGNVDVALTWNGDGEISTENIRRRYNEGELTINEHIRGSSRPAYAYGTVMLDSTNLTPSLSYSAYLYQAKSGTVTVQKGSRPGLPNVLSFTANPEFIEVGESTNLSWEVESKGKTSLTIMPDVGDVTKLSNIEVSPIQTTYYELTAVNRYGGLIVGTQVWVLGDDEYEPNNRKARATPIELDFYSPELTITRNDVDWFRFDLPETALVTVNLGTWNLEPSMALFDVNRVKLQQGDYNLEKELQAGRYYLAISGAGDRAFNGTHDKAGFYYFSVTAYIPSPPDGYEPNNSSDTSTPIVLDFASPELTITRNDVDWFRFSLGGATTLIADVNASIVGSSLDSYLGLFDSGLNMLAANDDWDGVDSYLELALEPGDYYLAVTGCCDGGFTGEHSRDGFYYLNVTAMTNP